MNGLMTELTPSCDAGTPVRRSARRRLVQSTLFPLKPPEPRDKPNERDDIEDEQDEDYYDSANKKKRKSKGKVTPPKKGSKSKNGTPKKKISANGIKCSASLQLLVDSDQVNTPVPDLRLEAKLSAEENSRMFAGRQIHPFFSSWKAGKKVQEQAESGGNLCTAKSGNHRITCGPIHVFENIQDDTSSLDWRTWTFLGNTAYVNHDPESSKQSLLEGSVESLNFDKLLNDLDPSAVSISQNALFSSDRVSTHPKNLQEISPSSSASPAEHTCPQMSRDAEVDFEMDESDNFPVHPGIFRKSDTEPLSRFLLESMRSYYHSSKDKAEGSLWTYKYKPTKAVEVCGNDESVNFLHDWLHQWHGRRYQSRKDTSNRDKSHKSDMYDDDDDYYCSPSGYDSEDIDEDSLKNVLLITGPTGSGKSAAVYACAQELGFDILELNASDCRNGTVVKQYFGDTLGSLGFKRLSENTASSQEKTKKLPSALPLLNGRAADKVNDGVVELISISDDEAQSPGETSRKLLDKSNVVACEKVQTLILVEDVDILFPEDRGCVAAIQQIAETARGPIILTSNSDDPGLPDNFDRLHVSFSLPSTKELICHLYNVCLTEGVNIHPLLLEKFIQSSDRDIRKTIMHIQFWFQSKRFMEDGKTQMCYGSLPFDLEVGHQILPKIMPWDFPSEISELIENEVAKSANTMEEKSSLLGLVREDLHIDKRQNDLDVQYMETDYIEAKKVEMIKRNGSITDYSELEIQYNAISEFSKSSGSPLASFRKNGRRKLVVMSSDSEDEGSYPVDTHDEANNRQCIKENNEFQLSEIYPSTSIRKLVYSELEDSEDEHFIYSETAGVTRLNETCESFDISCVPESTIVPETAIENGTETMSGAVSSGHVGPLEVSGNDDSKPFAFNVRKRLAKLSRKPDLLVNTEISDSTGKEVLQDYVDENLQTPIANVMDECSRVDFKRNSIFVESSPSTETDMVQTSWRDLRERRMDLRQHATSEQLGAFQVVKLASGLSNLISEADLFYNHQHKRDIMEPTVFLSDEALSSWYHEQIMMPTFAVHGFCLYAKLVADEGLKLDYANRVDLTSEMLASTTNIMALGKLSGQGLTKSTVIYKGKELESNNPINDMQKSENKTSLFEVIQSIVPARVSLALKGDTFNEYSSTLRQISRSEAFRVSQDVEKKRRGRMRGAQHYLSKCTMLSPEDISFVRKGDLYNKSSSQDTTKVEGKL